MAHMVIVDNPAPAAGLALLLGQHIDCDASALAPEAAREAPPGALLLIEERLPEHQSGLRLAHHLRDQRPDLVPLLWTRRPTPLTLWAAAEWKLPGVLDKAVPFDDLLRHLRQALTSRAVWPGDLLDRAWRWGQDAAVRLQWLTSCHWALWLEVIRGASSAEIAEAFGWSQRTVERRLTELYTALDAQNRAEAVSCAWEWGLVDQRPDGLKWMALVEDMFISKTAPPL